MREPIITFEGKLLLLALPVVGLLYWGFFELLAWELKEFLSVSYLVSGVFLSWSMFVIIYVYLKRQ
jgi:hypothetical protein